VANNIVDRANTGMHILELNDQLQAPPSAFRRRSFGPGPEESLSRGEVEEIDRAMDRFAVLIWHGQPFDGESR